MKTNRARNAALALLGLAALSVYILACTSFSPDDTKVLYPAFDKESGAIGLAVYDREAKRSELLFVPLACESGQSNALGPQFLRGQWLADGRKIVIAWAGEKDKDENLNLALVPSGAKLPLKVFQVAGVKDAGTLFLAPLCVAGEKILIRSSSTEVLRVDLKTGATETHEFKDINGEISLYPVPDGTGVFYTVSREQPDKTVVFGRLNPEDFSRTSLAVITNNVANNSFFAYDLDGKRLALMEKADEGARLVVLSQGKPAFARTLVRKGEDLAFGNAVFSPKADLLCAMFQLKLEGKDTVSYGLMEIPLSDAPIRETVLIAGAPSASDEVMYFQVSISHDGKTAAAASTYLACAAKELKADDCALFLVDLSDSARKVTRVPIPLPANRPAIK